MPVIEVARAAVNQFLTRKFAADRQVATGTVRVSDWERAREAVVDPSVEIGYRVEGGADPQGRPMVVLQLSGTVEVVCQRSLHLMPWPLGRRTTLLLAANQQELEAWDREVEDAEVVLANAPLDMNALLEDEFLLDLPFAPLCDDPECAKTLRSTGRIEVPAGERDDSNPFSVLRDRPDLKHTH